MSAADGHARAAFGAGKVILLGEHAVVYGHPALAGPLLARGVTAQGTPARTLALAAPKGLKPAQRDALQRAFARAAELTGAPPLRVRLTAELPLSMGLGSSGALSVAVARLLLGERATPARVGRVALAMEQEFHGTPSGVDHTTSALERLVLYRRAPGAAAGRARVLASPRDVQVVVLLAGPRSATKATVAALRERQARWPARYRRVFADIGHVAREGAAAVEAGDLAALGDCMNVNQGLLAALGLSSPRLEEAVHALRRLGALGAKLTGAGGDGGAVVGLFARDPARAVRALTRAGHVAFASRLAGPAAHGGTE